MRTMKNLALATMAVSALALAGCGGGGSSGSVSTPTDPVDPVDPVQVAAAQLNGYYAAGDAAEAAQKAAEMAVKYAAMDMLTAVAVEGDSAAATERAMAAFAASGDLDMAITDAKTAVAAAKAAMTAVESDAQKAALDRAIKEIEAEIMDAEKYRDGALKTEIARLVGDDEKMPRDAGYYGKQVAMAIGMALAPTSDSDGSGMRVNHGDGSGSDTDNPMPPEMAGATMTAVLFERGDADMGAMTWAQIFGDTKKAFGTGNAEIPVVSVEGEKLADLADTSTGDPLTALASVTDGQAVQYMGITGRLFCAGTECMAEADDGGNMVLKGMLYFAAADGVSEDQLYIMQEDGEGYMQYDLYASYGYWLTADANDASMVTLQTFASSDGINSPAGAITTNANAELAGTATYMGKAAGMSMMKSFDPDTGKDENHMSASFTADVMLEAVFGGSASLSGTISGFDGEAADTAWEVKLTGGDFASGAFEDGVTGSTDAPDGVWTAQAYGGSDASGEEKRPDGVYGGFNAHFANGHAAGAYITRKQ